MTEGNEMKRRSPAAATTPTRGAGLECSCSAASGCLPRGGSAGAVIQIHQNIGDNVRQVDLAAVAQAGRAGAMAAIAEERRRNPTGPFGG